jgi:hypothetical protein
MAVKRKAGRKSNGVNKSELIREILREMGGATRNKDVIAKLKEKSIVVSPAQVSNVKLALARKGGIRLKRRGRRGAVGRAAGGSGDSVSLSSLIAAKKLADSMGGLDRARRALDALARLS